MYRGTTPTLRFKLKNTQIDLDTATEIWVTLKSYPYVNTWDISRCSIDNENKTISISLSQEETLALPVSSVKAQIRILLSSGQAVATTIETVDVNEILRDGVIE